MLSRNVVLTFISWFGANAFSLLTVPLYLHLIGTTRYGVMAFVWLIIGYFGLFIVGLDRAITNLLSQHRHDRDAARSLFHTAMLLNLVTSCAGGVVMYFVGYQIMVHTVAVNDALRGEMLGAMPWIAASVPLATTTALLTGALEAYERFSSLATTQFCATVMFQVIPILVAWLIGPQLTWVLPAAIFSRVSSSIWMLLLLGPIMQLNTRILLRTQWVTPLLRYGGSISISGIVSPILSGLDRLLIGAALGAGAVSYYVVPSSLVNVAQMVPGSLLRVLFPRLSTMVPAAASAASVEACLTLGAILAPLITFGILFAHPFMILWLGASFAYQAQGIAEILLHGAWINCLAWVPVTLLQAQRRPGLVARLHVIELVPFVALVWVGVRFGGIHGAAIACSLRMWVDALLLFRVSGLERTLIGHLMMPTALVTAAMIASLSLRFTSPLYLVSAAALGIGSLAWAVVQIPSQQRRRVSAMFSTR